MKNNDTKEILLRDFLAFKFASSRETDKLINRLERFTAKELDEELTLALLSLKTHKSDNDRQPFEKSCEIAAPIFENLNAATAWSYIQFYVLTLVIGYQTSYDNAMAMLQEALDVILDEHATDKKYMGICAALHANMTIRIIRAKYLEPNRDKAELDKAFKRSYDHVMEVSVRKNLPYQHVMQARLGIFESNVELVKSELATLKELGEKKMYKTTKDELGEYLQFIKVKFGTSLFNFFVGYNARGERMRQGRRVSEIAGKLDMDDNVLNAIERGDGGMSIETLKELATTLGVTSDYLLYGDENKRFPKNLHIIMLSEIMQDATHEEMDNIVAMAKMMVKK